MKQSNASSRRPWGRLLLLVTANLTALPTAVQSQTAAGYNHWAAIDRGLRDIGGIANAGNARPDQRGLLAFHYSERGQFFLDLYEYDRLIVRDYALHRDSISKHGGPAVPAAQYFLGRAQQELGQTREAAAAYAAAMASAPEAIRTLASEWNATLTGSGGKGWKRDLLNWRDGKAVSPATCAPARPQCELFEAILAEDAPAMVRLERDLMQSPQPDYRTMIRTNAEPYPVEFFDPLPLYLLAAADYSLAAHVLKGAQGSPDIEALNGIALMRAGRTKDAEGALRRAVSSTGSTVTRGSAALGELLFKSGNAGEAERMWRSPTGQAVNMVLDARGRVGADAPAALRQNVLRQYEAERSRRFAGMKEGTAGGEYLARALIRQDRPREALEVLDAVRPPSFGSSLNKIRPDVLVLSSRARYALGVREALPEHFPFARGDLGDLAEDFPIVTPVLKLLQLITAPPNKDIVRDN